MCWFVTKEVQLNWRQFEWEILDMSVPSVYHIKHVFSHIEGILFSVDYSL